MAKTLRKIIEIDEDLCSGCGACVPSCHEGAIQIIDGKARLVADKYCDGLGACLGECPTGALRVVEREADVFDEEAVKAHLEAAKPPQARQAHACPSARMMKQLEPRPAAVPAQAGPQPSELGHWPVQIRLVAPHAPFLEGADLLVAADCVPVAYAGFHQDFLRGKAVMIGCPKFDDAQEYVEKFAGIFGTANVKSITVVVMQVPCCQGLPLIVRKGLELAGKEVPGEKVIISLEGAILARQPL